MLLERAGGDDDRAAGARSRPATRSCAAPRSTAARCTCSRICCRSSASRPRFVSLDELRAARALLIGRPTKLVWFESPINPTLRCVDIAAVAARVPGARRDLGHRQHLREPDQPAAAGARRRSRDAQRDEVPQRPQRRDGRRARGSARADASRSLKARKLLGAVLDPYAAYALGRGLKTLDGAGRAPQRERDGRGASGSNARPARRSASTIPGSSRIPITRSPKRRCAGSAAWSASIVGGGYERAARFFDRLQVFKRAASLGGVESLCSLPC